MRPALDATNRTHGGAQVTALGYVSSGDAAQLGVDLRMHGAAIEALCSARGWRLALLVHEIEPARGRCLARPALGDAVRRLAAGEASCLVVAELGRLYRSVANLSELLRALERADVRLVSLSPALDTGTESGRASAELLSAVSEAERRRAAERSRHGLAAAQAKGTLRPAIPPEVKRQIARMRGAGMTLQAIVDELNAAGVPTARGGAEWRPSSLQAAIGYKRPARA